MGIKVRRRKERDASESLFRNLMTPLVAYRLSLVHKMRVANNVSTDLRARKQKGETFLFSQGEYVACEGTQWQRRQYFSGQAGSAQYRYDIIRPLR